MEHFLDLFMKSHQRPGPVSQSSSPAQQESSPAQQEPSSAEQVPEGAPSTKATTRSPFPEHEQHIRSIDDSLFIELVRSTWDKSRSRTCKVIDRNAGSYNYCVTLDLNEEEEFVVRVPFRGTRETWTEDHAFELRTEILNMKYLYKKTKIPLPFIHQWDDGFDNILGAPYIIMDRIYGVSAHENLWYDEEMWAKTADGTSILPGADSPSPELERKRLRFLQDLAKIMADLQNHVFDKMGAPQCADHWDPPPPTVGHYFEHSHESWVKRGPFSSTAEYLQLKKDEIAAEALPEYDSNNPSELTDARAFSRIAPIMYDALPRSVDKYVTDADYETTPETFVLAHPDLDLQNIFVDEDGEITGIIDWAGLRTVPRWAGWASFPLFLRKDFDHEYTVLQTSFEYPHAPWKLDFYRKAYHGYLQETLDPEGTGSYNDGKYTLKSGATCAALEALDRWVLRDANIHRLLKEIPVLKGLFIKDFRERLGSEEGWPAAEAMLKEEFKALFRHT
ncbi:uncharacterized protein N0V89_001791 [Didymosphaeria variabile]|uniref:Aminoglycoside phosphotransferase domain-containing protein n=1 Tax=Didymosphaeria variabile TaxID=1932322 RepID=A0A9W9CCX8_9PLEO|nr:uncharacterized protein N0V89_001791 [Didymosphaeria variabile]KAJ4357216.1 hypothetical protein N0V89_001791 [Didymosphaeria variabile]